MFYTYKLIVELPYSNVKKKDIIKPSHSNFRRTFPNFVQ